MARKVRSLASGRRRGTEPRDYYEVLRVHPSADALLIREAYWHLARRYQADMRANPDAAKRLDELNQAYDVLGTPARRESYDKSTRASLAAKDVDTRAKARPAAAKVGESKRAAKEAQEPKKERSSGVIRWEMPALQAVVAVLGLLVLGAMALWYGAPVLLTLILVGVALFCTLFPWRFGRIFELPRLVPERGHEERQADASALRESTAAMVARWRQEMGLKPQPSTEPSLQGQGDTKGRAERPGARQQ